jgi:hypothetical protein
LQCTSRKQNSGSTIAMKPLSGFVKVT